MRKSTVASICTVLLLASSLSACSTMTTKQRNAAIGAAVGGVAGNVIGGDTGSTLGGAALGGLVGSQVK
ncbi:glycine zipper 2TM domain-containing protein [Eikenella corrodens]|uniref:Glycine zipper 2TM domain-containing protein n=1 Tax=Eikenella corrodens TaxID=539 RepID=A0A3S9SJC5_EIKCO|nr:glycine zipper 2TM domain-containing protein [Eikenella corrodens]AZR59645.1 glycine zipper 2TM domain-containing protein [Eikenella corrodens]